MQLFVGNLSFKATDDDLRKAFEAYGRVIAARIVKERDTGRSRGFGFVEFADDAGAKKAVELAGNLQIQGRNVKVTEAKPREDRAAH